MHGLSEKEFKNEFVSNFNGDKTGNLRPRQTPGVLYSKAVPTPVSNPQLLAWSNELAKDLGICEPGEKDVLILGGNRVTPSMFPYAACYAGHQFGNWAGQLGDGRAITLGEWPTYNNDTWELQLKGAGPTAYSRRADGRAVLRSSVREYLMSEAMHHLGVPTTRALSLVGTGDKVLRDMFYSGNAQYEPGAIVMRAAPTLLRFGNFEMLASRNELGDLRKLVEWTIKRYYPHISGDDKIEVWFKEVVERTAKLMVEWMRVGFVHGVMNTDNMSVLGLTIDYGPYSFVDDYDLNFTPNTTDLPGRRYAFGKQPAVGKWNLGCLGGALAPLLPDAESLIAALDEYDSIYWKEYYNMMANKLGLGQIQEADVALITELEITLSLLEPDMTIFFQLLISLPEGIKDNEEVLTHFHESFYEEPGEAPAAALFSFIQKYNERLKKNSLDARERQQVMKKTSPRFILRNYLLHQAIEELETGGNTLFRKLEEALKEPYSNQWDQLFVKRPDWANEKAGCSMLSCSS